MATIGVIFCAWQSPEYTAKSLAPWVEARAKILGENQFVICAVNVPFVGFNAGEDINGYDETDTGIVLTEAYNHHDIDHLIRGDSPHTEVEARGEALRWLIHEAKVDMTVLVDNDELFTTTDIFRIFKVVEQHQLIAWFRLSLKNYVFDSKTYLTEPFQPPRIFRTRVPGHSNRVHSFYDDNNVLYGGTITRDLLRDTEFASVTIPPMVAWISHWSWLSDLRSKKKVEYQRLRWGHCSFKWSDDVGLTFDLDYFQQQGQMIPQTKCIDGYHGPQRLP